MKAAIVGFASTLIFGLAMHLNAATSDWRDVTMIVYVPCVGIDGEMATLEGRLHTTQWTASDQAGGLHWGWTTHGTQLVGTGWETGDTYRLIPMYQVSYSRSNPSFPITYTDIFKYRVIGQGDAVNSQLHATWHFTINANGDVTIEFLSSRFTCE